MGPMIDMVFLLLVFFMVSAKPIKPETDIPIGLPGQVSAEESIDIPDEQRIEIQPSGQAVINDLSVDGPNQREMPDLVAILSRFKRAADNNKADALVTLAPHDEVAHQRIVDVLNACAQAGITGVTMARGGGDE